MLVVSLRGVHFGFWSHLGCSGQNAIKFSCKDLSLGLHTKKKKLKNHIFSIRFIYSIHVIKVENGLF